MTTLTNALTTWLASGDTASVREAVKSMHPADIANEIGGLKPADAARVLTALPPDWQGTVFGYFDAPFQIAMAKSLSRTELARIVTAMSHDERADLWKRLDPTARDALMPALAQAEREDIRRLAAYEEGTAGALMTSDYATLSAGMTVREALASLRKEAPDAETIYAAYIVDEDRTLLGVVSLRDLILAEEHARVGDLMQPNPASARVDDSKDTVAEKIANYDVLALPVVTDGNRLVGIVTVDDALDIARGERARRLTQFGAAAPVRGGPDLDLRNSSFGAIFKVRVFWLSLLVFFGAITSTFVAGQEELLSEVLILAAFIAPIVDMGGNTGSQSATLVIRGMALGQFKLRWQDIWFVIRREIPVALALGVVIAILEAVLAVFTKGVGFEVLMVVGLAMAIVTISGALIGALLPFAARRIGTDPATLSSPMITSIMDMLGVFIYFALAYAFLGHLLEV
ncbi:magnesium transporter [Paracoccus bogoriensis]|uniref:magnesium transporter n=1 Tax=Paracoccus bogoriensis TaxID=242065 RepID=UPI001CA51F9C|nr:magnesium transporter [Paracoccus bogoriensis]MBW7056105.1 magnesium transporter [Paracoccus bogoriensis]